MASYTSTNTNTTASAPVWLITGCSSGIGLAIARQALALGHNVIATSRNPSKTPDVVNELSGNPQGHFLALDVTAPYPQIKSFIDQATALHGRIDILINNAGYCVLGSIEDISLEKYQQQMATNFFGPAALIKAVLPAMRARRSGTIINISSGAGLVAPAGNGVYSASKHALEAMTEALAAEVSPFNIRVASIVLGAFRTSFGQAGADVVMDRDNSDYGKDGHPVYERLKYISKLGELAQGSPEKAAAVICEVAQGKEELRDPENGGRLLRFVLGKDCWTSASGKIETLRRTWDVQRESCKRTTVDA